MAAATEATVGILTYRRPGPVVTCISAVLEQIEAAHADPTSTDRIRIVVVDNDPERSAEGAVRALDTPLVTYVAEPEPGISAARNRAIDEAAGSRILVFIDDDERPDDGWLAALLSAWRATGAAAVTGRVISEFDGTVSPWVDAGRFFERRNLPTGTAVSVAATNNLLLDLDRIRDFGLRFDRRLGLTGGEDTMLSRRITQAGGTIVWCAEAVVRDVVPASRSTARWVLTRACSSGNSAAMVELLISPPGLRKLARRAILAGRGASRLVAGLARCATGLVMRSYRQQARGLRTAARGAGLLSGALGFAYQEYGRSGRRFRSLRDAVLGGD